MRGPVCVPRSPGPRQASHQRCYGPEALFTPELPAQAAGWKCPDPYHSGAQSPCQRNAWTHNHCAPTMRGPLQRDNLPSAFDELLKSLHHCPAMLICKPSHIKHTPFSLPPPLCFFAIGSLGGRLSLHPCQPPWGFAFGTSSLGTQVIHHPRKPGV